MYIDFIRGLKEVNLENKTEAIKISSLCHTWILDLDGTFVKHNGYKIDGFDTLLDGAKTFLDNIPENDYIIFITSRSNEYRQITEKFLEQSNIRYNNIIYNAPYGERILINDRKPSCIDMAVAINVTRDTFDAPIIKIDKNL